LRYLLIILILLYVVVYQIFYSGEYVKAEPPVGTVRFSFRAPSADACNPLHHWCELRLRNLTDLPYCGQNSNADALMVLNCTYMDSAEAVSISDSRAFLTTYFEELKQERACKAEDTTCKHLWLPAGGQQPGANHRQVFVADVERFTLMLDHAVTAPTSKVKGSVREFQGFLETQSPSLCATHPNRTARPVEPGEPLVPTTGPPCYIKPNSTSPTGFGFDVFEMSTLLQAAGMDLDGPKEHQEEHSVRREGGILVVEIKYKNSKPWKGTTRKVHYSYEVTSMPGDAKRVLVDKIPPDQRVVFDRHGVEIFVIQTGSLKAFDALKLLVTLTTALTMLAVANFIVDSVALYMLPERDLFNKVKYPSARIHDPDHNSQLKKHPAYDQSDNDASDDSDEDSDSKGEHS